MAKRIWLTAAFAASACLGMAQDKPKWDVSNPSGLSMDVTFTTDEGTWMNLDVSPDGKTIAFDMLGDIYTIPITGGKAKLLRGGLPFEVQPRFSPDGKQISFTSDAGGGDNIWVMNTDGAEARQVTKESFRLLNNATWMPDGQWLVARKHFTNYRSLGAGEMWMYHITGGDGIQLTKRKNDQMDAGEPEISPDGRYVYFSEDMSPGGTFQYNKDPHGQIYIIRRYDRTTGATENIVTGPGGAARPQLSPDGKLLAFVRRVRMQTVLFLRDLQTGEEWPIWDRLNKDQQETWAIFGVYPNYAWMPDGKEVVIWAEGKFWRINVETRAAVNIPFEAEVTQRLINELKFPQEVAPATFTAKMIRNATTSPDGKQVAFNAAGHIYVKRMPDAAPKRISQGDELEFYPSFSNDGKKLVYTTWTDKEMGRLKVLDVATGSIRTVINSQGYYHQPRFSADGQWIVYERSEGTGELGFAFGQEPGIYLCKIDGSDNRRLLDHGDNAWFSPDGKQVYFHNYEEGGHALKRIDLDGKNESRLFFSKYASNYAPSPDGKWIAFTELFNAYVAAFPQTGQSIDLAAGSKSYPVFKVTRDAGTSLHWSGDSKTLHWMLGQEYFSRDLTECFTFLPGSPDSLPPVDTAGIPLNLVLPTDIPSSVIALKGARIITMKGDEVIENGVIVVEKNRITAIGTEGTITIPANAKVVDVSGKTIMPGLVDVHAHLGNSGNGISPQQQWSYHASIAYGVTTTHDPSSNTEMVFSQSEMVKAGVMVGPRIYSTGTILYGAEGDFKAIINSFDDAVSHLRRMKAVGAFSVKSYNQPRRDQRQQVIEAARKLEMMVYPEGGSFFFHNMTMILDGHTGVEHSIPVSPVYKDVITVWGKSGTGYTPTLIVGYGGIWGENYWYQKTEVWKNERLLKYYPRGVLDSRSMRRMMVPDEDFGHIGNAKTCKAIMDGGAKLQLGAHGQLHGLGAHWELWMLAQGGLSPLQAIRAGTLWGAEYIGMDKDIGSLEPGKLADLIVLDKNPLEDIRNTEFVNMTMINGRLYDAATMNEKVSRESVRKPFFWESAKGSAAFKWHGETHSFMVQHCGCWGAH